MTDKIVVCIMGQDCKDFAEIALESVKGADAIVFCDGGSKPEFLAWLIRQGFYPHDSDVRGGQFDGGVWDVVDETGIKFNADKPRVIIQQEFSQTDPLMNGKQRNFYLNFLKKFYEGWWCLCLDADEVVDDFSKLKEFLPKLADGSWENAIMSVHMRHLVYHFAAEDATKDRHYVPNRFFKINWSLEYPLGEHVILQNRNGFVHAQLNVVTIWHLAYSPLFHIRSRYRKNTKHSNVHSKEFLDGWYQAHLFGQYPVKPVNPNDLPRVLLDHFNINKDSLYFKGRGIEAKHFIDAGDWRDHFQLQGESLLEWGCGLAPRVYAAKVCGVDAYGIELSQWAMEHSMCPRVVQQGDVTGEYTGKQHKLVVAYDLLEHVPYELLNAAIKNLAKSSKQYILVSVPTLGDPNLDADPTHIIKETKDWWREQFLATGLKELPVPEHFQFKQQLLIFEVTSDRNELPAGEEQSSL